MFNNLRLTRFTPTMIPLVLVLMNICFMLTAYPVGKISDSFGRSGLISIGLAVLIAADLVLMAARTPWHVILGTALWGFHMGLTQGLLSALVTDTSPPELRGTAFGLFNLPVASPFWPPA